MGIKSYESCQPHFRSLKLLTLPSLYVYETAVFVKNNSAFFVNRSQTCGRDLRFGNKICAVSSHTALLNKNILQMAPTIFNKLPSRVKDLQLIHFKRELHNILIEKCYYSVLQFLNDSDMK